MRMKKDCNGCRALITDWRSHGTCTLGFIINNDATQGTTTGEQGTSPVYNPTPGELCPKPRTWKAFYDSPSPANIRDLYRNKEQPHDQP